MAPSKDTVRRDDQSADPLGERRALFELLGQETRHQIVQNILGHPAHLLSVAELDYMISKTRKAITDQLDVLVDADIIAQYDHPPNETERALPSQFYGFTEYGIEALRAVNYLRGLSAMRALYDHTQKSERIERHEDAPRPALPEAVTDALAFETPALDAEDIRNDEGKI